ncbi:sugar-binding transcriptional regulator [uncultured Megasphaera sp.]|uniref:sugar-binding transcriptional regulator n=1 Tax=uncultured Megasphaera sp. TaxID=165188 RepID=UPI00261B3605|nr:sugar-binding transcriptional regulator [uncultured Megasphaera sp.]
MAQDKDALSIDVAKLYYESDMSQQKIANKLGISRPSVSRFLQYAKEQGFVQIKIVDPIDLRQSLGDKLCKKYHLKDAIIANAPLDDDQELKKAIGQTAASYLWKIVKDNDIIGVGWGSSLYQMALQLKTKPVKGVQVVQLKGGISYSKVNTYAHEIVTLVADAFSTTGIFLPIPVMFDNVEVKRLVEHDKYVKNILDMGKKANIAVVTVGTASSESILFHLGYYIDDKDRELLSKKAAGDLCSRFYDDDYNIVDEELNARTVGLQLDEFKKKETRILVAGGKEKIRAIHTALKAGYMNVLITDRYTALALENLT